MQTIQNTQQSPNHVGYSIFSLSYIVPFTKPSWFIVTTPVQFISIVTWSNIKEQNILSWIFISFAKRWFVAKSEFCMELHSYRVLCDDYPSIRILGNKKQNYDLINFETLEEDYEDWVLEDSPPFLTFEDLEALRKDLSTMTIQSISN
ncbi:transmembrane protein, putative [Medicago truncatula]|uniref:Transmembrane protein, putative n=1 Tax=Medicago truncatula TaxID=3880 RepID=A0A072U803_MEDTR|nr:transmembrane protein, putative [Medicago truncatula]